MQVPNHILERCEIHCGKDHVERIVRIKPVEPCECGRELDNTRIVRLALTVEPVRHWRAYCHTCKLVCPRHENTWRSAKEWNEIMRKCTYLDPKETGNV